MNGVNKIKCHVVNDDDDDDDDDDLENKQTKEK